MQPRRSAASDASDSSYDVRIIHRDGDAQVPDDWHATITRRLDGAQAIITASWRWLILRKTRRAALDRMFARIDRHERKMAEVWEFRR